GQPADARRARGGRRGRGPPRIARRLLPLARPPGDPERGRPSERRAPLGRAPHVRRGQGDPGRDLEEPRAIRPPHAPQGLAPGPGRRGALRAHRRGNSAGEGHGDGARRERLQGLLLLRVGEEVASGDRRAGGRVSPLRAHDVRLAGGSGGEGMTTKKDDEADPAVSRREFLARTTATLATAGALPALAAAAAEKETAAFPTRVLGRTGVSVPILAFGCGSRFLMYEEESAALAVLERALALGVRY